MHTLLIIVAPLLAFNIALAVVLTTRPPVVRQHSNLVHLTSERASRVIGHASSKSLRQF